MTGQTIVLTSKISLQMSYRDMEKYDFGLSKFGLSLTTLKQTRRAARWTGQPAGPVSLEVDGGT